MLLDFIKETSSISCVNLFVLISGYFGIKWKVRGISSLVFQVYFWIFLIWGVCLAIGMVSFTWMDLIKNSFGILNAYWFIPAYLGLYLFAPVLNAFSDKATNKELFIWIGLFLLFQTLDSLPYSQRFTGSGYNIISFCGLYMIGRLLKRGVLVTLKCFNRRYKLIIWIVGVTLILAIAAYFLYLITGRDGGGLQSFPLSPLAYNNPLVIFQSSLIFMLFMTFNFKSRFINWCAVSALAIYLLHMHPNLKQLYYGYSRELYSLDVINHYLRVILLMISVAIVAIPVDKLRMHLFDKSYNWSRDLICKIKNRSDK